MMEPQYLVQADVDVSASDKMPVKTESKIQKIPDKIENTNSSAGSQYYISRPQALTDNSKSGEGPTIKTDVYDFFSLFPINEANILDLIENIEHKDENEIDTASEIPNSLQRWKTPTPKMNQHCKR